MTPSGPTAVGVDQHNVGRGRGAAPMPESRTEIGVDIGVFECAGEPVANRRVDASTVISPRRVSASPLYHGGPTSRIVDSPGMSPSRK